MEENTNRSSVNWCQIGIGTVALLIGTLVYLIDRSPDQTYFIYIIGLDFKLYKILPSLFGPIGNNLPAFIHVFSFILITAGVLACKKNRFITVCAIWLFIDSIFELGQQYNSMALNMIPDWFSGFPFLENTRNYFLNGTFDPIDIAAVLAGTLTAYVVLIMTMEKGV